MNSKDTHYYKLIISNYYIGKATEKEIVAIERAFNYFNSPTINLIIEERFKNNTSFSKIGDMIEYQCEKKLSRTNINNRIGFFLDQLRYELK